MVSRLPQPGSDAGSWGDILNDYLSQSLKADGSLRDNIVTPAAIAPSAVDGTAIASASIDEGKLDTAVQAKLNAGASAAADATASSKGIIQLAGDLGGTAATPTIPGLSGKADVAHTHSIANVTNLQASLDAKADQTALTTGLAGKANTSHVHAINDTTGLQTALDTKANQATTYTITEVDSALSAKPDAINTYTKAEVDASLSGKANTSHAHAISDTTGLQTSLDNKANQVTTYTKTEVDGALSALPSSTHTHKQTLPYSQAGTLAIKTGSFHLYNDSDAAWTIQGVRASGGAAPTGASILVDVNCNGTTIFTTQGNRPVIADGTVTSGLITSMNVTSVPVGDYLTVDIDQVGSTFAGTDLCVQVTVK